jgi:hypothetical protein
VIVNKLSARRKRNTAAFPNSILNYDKTNCKAECFYIAAELENRERDFEVGDGKMYGKYKNAELEPSTTYKIYVRGVSYNYAKVAYICFSFNYISIIIIIRESKRTIYAACMKRKQNCIISSLVYMIHMWGIYNTAQRFDSLYELFCFSYSKRI